MAAAPLPTRPLRVAAVDLGASSGRVMVGTVDPGAGVLALEEVHRFPNGPVTAADGSLRWDIRRLHQEVLTGLAAAGPVHSVGIDSWAVDYGLLDEQGRLLGDPYCYRDARTVGMAEKVRSVVGDEELYAVTGLQHLPFNTIYQLAAETSLSRAGTMLLIPDLLGYWLTGAIGAEATNASTTQLYDVRTRTWATGLAERVGVPAGLLPRLREPGEVVGTLHRQAARATGLPAGTPVVAVGSHDTASAVVGVPASTDTSFAYISSGTWSLVGTELDRPVLTEEARAANFTNEGGVDGTVRLLRNVMGLWVLSETMRTWGRDGPEDLAELLSAAGTAPAFGPVVDVDGPAFLPPGDMPARIAAACEATGQRPPATPGETVRCILESLALAYRRQVRAVGVLSGRPVDVVHVVGGGARNRLLCQLTADACGVPVLAGPVEAAALGNVLVQARTLGADLPDLAAMRALVTGTHTLDRYEPQGSEGEWVAVEGRSTLMTGADGV
ncbi:MAG TPA: rhamnulokinase family protein [Nocardioidaceae bacterium]|nr:rhamnulokinase family protein [Nocardioidaceae bacterium]